jgi:hypothetical protein
MRPDADSEVSKKIFRPRALRAEALTVDASVSVEEAYTGAAVLPFETKIAASITKTAKIANFQ